MFFFAIFDIHPFFFFFFSVSETHQVAEAQQEKNARLREAFGISEYFVDGSSFDPDRQAKEKIAKSVAIQEKERQKALDREKQRDADRTQAQRYQLVHTPTPEREEDNDDDEEKDKEKEKSVKKKKKKSRERLVSLFLCTKTSIRVKTVNVC